ncbi:MAG: SIS domain-containing protein [Bacteroidota bacterium]
MPTDSLSRLEIMSQPDSWRQTLEAVEDAWPRVAALFTPPPGQILICGCGASYWGGQALASYLQGATGTTTRSVTASELWLTPERYVQPGRSLFLWVPSRSGHTTEVLEAVTTLRSRYAARVLAVTCTHDAPLAELADAVVAIPWAAEASVCQTRSFSNLYLAGLGLAARWSRDEAAGRELANLPGVGKEFLASVVPRIDQLAADLDWDHFVALGSGPLNGIANACALIVTEMSGTWGLSFQAMEARHGPAVVMGDKTVTMLITSDRGWSYERRVLEELRARSARSIVITSRAQAFAGASCVLPVAEHLSDLGRGLCAILVAQRIANLRATAKGLDPDAPCGLVPWIATEVG